MNGQQAINNKRKRSEAQQVDLAVITHLKKRGYAKAAAALEQETKQHEPCSGANQNVSKAEANLVSPRNLLKMLRKFHKTQIDPGDYERTYRQLETWIHSSLDLYKEELSVVLFPVFVHFFLDLIESDHTREATRLMNSFGRSHERSHKEEIAAVQSIVSKNQIRENEKAKMFREHKADVQLSAYSHHLLVSFMEDQKLLLLLKVVNEHVNLSIGVSKPQENADRGFGASYVVTEKTESQRDEMNATPIRWGALARIVDAENINRKNIAHNNDGQGILPPKLTVADVLEQLPVASERSRNELVAKFRERRDLNTEALPSCCFYTFKNTPHSVASVNVSSEGRLVVACMTHSVIKLWDLEEKILDDEEDGPPQKRSSVSSFSKSSSSKFRASSKSSSSTSSSSSSSKHSSRSSSSSGATSKNGTKSKTSGSRNDWDEDYQPSRKRTASGNYNLVGHSGPVYATSFSSDSKLLLSASEDGTVRLWHTGMKHNLVVYRGHNYPIWDVQFSPVDFYFVSASLDRTARLWSVDKVYPLRVFAGHLCDVDCVKFHPSCNYIGTGSTDKTFRLWDVRTGNDVRLFTGHKSKINAMSFAPDGRHAATAGDHEVIVWDLAEAKRVVVFHGHTRPITCLDYSGNGSSLLASGSYDKTVRLWDFDRQSKEAAAVYTTKETPITFLRFTSQNLLLGAGLENGTAIR